MKVTCVVPRLVSGGGARSTIDFAHEQNLRYGVQGSIVSLGAHHESVAQSAREAGLDVFLSDDSDGAGRALREADIVHVAFWNTPEMCRWLASDLPPMRLVLKLHIAGEYPAQVLTAPLLDFADWIIVASRVSLALPVFQKTLSERSSRVCWIPDSQRMSETTTVAARSHLVRVGYVGMVDFVKMLVELCAAVEMSEMMFPVAGGGTGFKTLQRQADQRGIASRFEWLGYQENPNTLLATLDLFGYPLCLETYAATDLILQQAMWLGIPPVILPYGGLSDLVQHMETGMIVSETDYAPTIRELVRDESTRARLAANARAYAHEHFGVEKHVASLQAVYENAMAFEKRERAWQALGPTTRFVGAAALIQAFGSRATPYYTSLTSDNRDARREAEFQIAHASPVETNVGGGGILDYRRAYPQDAMLRLWAGLVLAQQQRFALAAAEFYAARELGLAAERIEFYLQCMMHHQPCFEEL
jgi:hypothetical protein